MTDRSRRRARTAALAAAGLGLAAAAAVAAERHLIRRARSGPDPAQDERLAFRPGTERLVRSFDGTELAVNVVGPDDAPALVFAHGFTMNLTEWHYQWRALSERYRCVLFDHRGHGHSGPARDGHYSLEAMGRDLRAVLDEAVPEGPAVLVGHSLGGMAIMAFAEQFPSELGTRVRGVLLANTAASDVVKAILGNLGERAALALLPVARRLVADPARAARLRSRLVGGGADLAFLIARATNFGPNAPASMVDYVVSVSAEAPVDVWTDVMTSLVQLDLAHTLEHIRVPALVIASDLDRLTPPATARAIVHRLPNGRLEVIGGAGHCAMLEKPEEFNRLLEAFAAQTLSDRPARVRA